MKLLLFLLMCFPALGQMLVTINTHTGGVSCTTPTGTTLTESWGDASLACAWVGTTGCNSLWGDGDNSGAADSIAASPAAAAANTACGFSLYNNTAGTLNTIYTTGTFPTLNDTIGYEVEVYFYPVSKTISNFGNNRFITLNTLAGSGNYKNGIWWNGGGGNLCIEGIGTAEAATCDTVTMGAWQTFRIHIQSGAGNSWGALNGGTHHTFTSQSGDTPYLVVGSTSVVYYIGYIRIDSAAGAMGNPSTFVDFAGTTNGTTVTAALLNAGSHCVNSAWVLQAGGTHDTFVSSPSHNLVAPVTACGTSYSGNTGLMLKHDTQQLDQWQYPLKRIWPNTTVAFDFQYTVSDAETGLYPIARITGSTGDFANFQRKGDGAGGSCIELEYWNSGSTAHSGCIATSPNTTYRAFIRFIKDGTHQIAIKDASGNQVGSTVTAGAASSGGGGPLTFEIGHVGATATTAGFFYYGNISLDYTGPAIPNAY